MAKGQLRHIAISVPDKEKTAKFYEETFGFKRVSESVVATRLTDGVINLTFLQFRNQDDAGDERGKDFVGIYPYALRTRKSAGLMTRKLSVTESQKTAQFFGTSTRRKCRTDRQKSL